MLGFRGVRSDVRSSKNAKPRTDEGSSQQCKQMFCQAKGASMALVGFSGFYPQP